MSVSVSSGSLLKSHWLGIFTLTDEEYPCLRKSGISGICQFSDSGVVHVPSDKQRYAQRQKDPPQPVVAIEVTWEVGGKPDDRNPLSEGQTKAGDGSISTGGG